MGTLAASLVLSPSSLSSKQSSLVIIRTSFRKKNKSIVPVARLFGPAIFEASKLKVLFLGVDKEKQPGKLPRIYTLTDIDITSKLTLAISQTINNSQEKNLAKENARLKEKCSKLFSDPSNQQQQQQEVPHRDIVDVETGPPERR